MDLSTARENTTRVNYSVTIPGHARPFACWADVNLAKVTPGFMARVAGYEVGRPTEDRNPLGILDALCEVVQAWDLTDNGVPVPVTTEALVEVPTAYIEALSTAVARAAGVDPRNAEPSDGGSAPMASSTSGPTNAPPIG